ncbi:MAG: hypothetical protein SGPRY_012393, partial [Prymnesium sp.]
MASRAAQDCAAHPVTEAWRAPPSAQNSSPFPAADAPHLPLGPSHPLPPGWVVVPHESGRPCYQHLPTKVVSWAPPYAVPEEEVDVSRHHVPPKMLSALQGIPSHRAAKWQRVQQPPPAGATATPLSEPRERVAHRGCPPFDIQMEGKSVVNILNEFCPKVLRCFPEIVSVTSEDPTNPFLTSVLVDGVLVARGRASSKKASRQAAAALALQVLAPLLPLPESKEQTEAAEKTGDFAVGAAPGSTEALEKRELDTLRLSLSDDRILDNTVGKTPVMVLQEHCHKHFGSLPTYTDSIDPHYSPSGPAFRVRAAQMVESASDPIKKKAKQRCALQMLRRLYPHVELWETVAAATNSRK